MGPRSASRPTTTTAEPFDPSSSGSIRIQLPDHNEIDFAGPFRTARPGLFQPTPARARPRLRQDIEPVAGGTTTPQCWLVWCPGTLAQENPPSDRCEQLSPPVDPAAGPTGSPSPAVQPGRSTVPPAMHRGGGRGELAAEAFSSWERPCACPAPHVHYIENNDDQARRTSPPHLRSVGMSGSPIPSTPGRSAALSCTPR